jgi:hypothetical protein
MGHSMKVISPCGQAALSLQWKGEGTILNTPGAVTGHAARALTATKLARTRPTNTDLERMWIAVYPLGVFTRRRAPTGVVST